AAVDVGDGARRAGLEGGGVIGDDRFVHGPFAARDDILGTGDARQALQDQGEVRGPLAYGPGLTLGEEVAPGLVEEEEVGGVGLGPAGQGEGAGAPETVHVGVRADPHLSFGPADYLGRS